MLSRRVCSPFRSTWDHLSFCWGRVFFSHGVVSSLLTYEIDFSIGMFYLSLINVVFCNFRYSSSIFETPLISIWSFQLHQDLISLTIPEVFFAKIISLSTLLNKPLNMKGARSQIVLPPIWRFILINDGTRRQEEKHSDYCFILGKPIVCLETRPAKVTHIFI